MHLMYGMRKGMPQKGALGLERISRRSLFENGKIVGGTHYAKTKMEFEYHNYQKSLQDRRLHNHVHHVVLYIS